MSDNHAAMPPRGDGPSRDARIADFLRRVCAEEGLALLTFKLVLLLGSPEGYERQSVVRPAPSLRQASASSTSGRRAPGGDNAAAGGLPLTPTEEAVLDVLRAAGRPLKGILIARKTGRQTCGSHLRGTLARLVQLELIRHTPDGYELGPPARRPDAEAGGREG